jgi:hypothetical protein
MNRRPAVAAVVTTLAAIAAGACGDELVAPEADTPLPLAATAAEREQMRVDLLFAQEQSAVGLPGEKGLNAALARLSTKVERNDQQAVERETNQQILRGTRPGILQLQRNPLANQPLVSS